MKYFVTVLFLLSFVHVASAQITLTESDFLSSFGQPNAQTSFSSTDTTGVRALENQAGAAVTWDFRGRTYTQDQPQPTTSMFLTCPCGVALASDPDFTSATHVLKNVASDQSLTYLFIKIDATGFWFLGESKDSMGVTSKVLAYKPPLQESAFPLTYGTSPWHSSSSIESSFLPPGAIETESIDGAVDAYGTLLTPPSQSNQAIRVRQKTTTSYSVTVAGMTYSNTSTSFGFNWYTKNLYGASIAADSDLRPSSVSYSQPGAANSVANSPILPDDPLTIRLSANPASNVETKLSFMTKSGGPVVVALMDNLGRSVRMLQNGFVSAGMNEIPIDARSLAPGTYFIRVTAEGMSAMRKLVISR